MKCEFCPADYEVQLGQRMNICPACKVDRVKRLNREKDRRWRLAKPEMARAKSRKHYRLLRKDVVDHYGGKCVCCGESEIEFLELDHTNNDGAAHRLLVSNGRRTRGSSGMCHWAKRNNYPPILQLLCCNCNRSKHLNGGVCVHQQR